MPTFLSSFLLTLTSLLPLAACTDRQASAPDGSTTESLPTQPSSPSVAQKPDCSPLVRWKAGTVVTDSIVAAYGEHRCFSILPIDDATFKRMRGRSYKEGCTVARNDLRLLHVLHCNEKGETQLGEMVCHHSIASDLLDIFRQLYAARYTVARMVLIDDYEADDERSMTANNSSCFNFRRVAGSKVLSKHSRGLAVDINPLRNPMVKRRADGKLTVSPTAGRRWADRSRPFAQRIDHADLAYRLFTAHGFRWGGNWRSVKDYQHFEK